VLDHRHATATRRYDGVYFTFFHQRPKHVQEMSRHAPRLVAITGVECRLATTSLVLRKHDVCAMALE
jgi:hypothetical protein